MAHGLLIKNDAGNVQVDGEYSNLVRHTSGAWSVPAYGYFGNYAALAEVPIIARKQAVGVEVIQSGAYKNAAGNYSSTWIWANSGTSLNYLIFRQLRTSDIPTSGHGLLVFNGAGTPVFSSNLSNYLKVLSAGVYPAALSRNISCVDLYNNYIIVRPGVMAIQGDGWWGWTYLYTKVVNKTTLNVRTTSSGTAYGYVSFAEVNI